MSGMPDDRLRAETELRIRHALARIQRAQDDLNGACSDLSAICGGIPMWRATSKMADRVRALWYRVEALRMKARHQPRLRIRLDDTNIEGILRREAERVPAGGAS